MVLKYCHVLRYCYRKDDVHFDSDNDHSVKDDKRIFIVSFIVAPCIS